MFPNFALISLQLLKPDVIPICFNCYFRLIESLWGESVICIVSNETEEFSSDNVKKFPPEASNLALLLIHPSIPPSLQNVVTLSLNAAELGVSDVRTVIRSIASRRASHGRQLECFNPTSLVESVLVYRSCRHCQSEEGSQQRKNCNADHHKVLVCIPQENRQLCVLTKEIAEASGDQNRGILQLRERSWTSYKSLSTPEKHVGECVSNLLDRFWQWNGVEHSTHIVMNSCDLWRIFGGSTKA